MANTMAALRTSTTTGISRSILNTVSRRPAQHLPRAIPSSPQSTRTRNLSTTFFSQSTRSTTRPISYTTRTAPSSSSYVPNFILQSSRSTRSPLFSRLFSRSRPRRQEQASHTVPPPKDETTLSGRLKKLSREYGWSALGVYLLLSAADFPFCFLLVRTLGTDRIGEWEHLIVSYVKKVIPESVKTRWHEWRQAVKEAEKEYTGSQVVNDGVEMAGWGVEEAEEAYKSDASLATQLALAYAIHKSFIFIRVPLTVAVTPKIVGVLRSWGWNIGKRTTPAVREVNKAQVAAKKAEKAARKAAKRA